MKIAIIGAGSSYTPEIIEGLVRLSDRLPVEELALVDINAGRLQIMESFCKRYLKRLGGHFQISATSRRAALEGSAFVLTQIRVGGNAQRVHDEKIPLRYGVIGQETTGPGGMFKALRTIPVMLDIARDVMEYSPEAWMINYTNPTGLIVEALARQSGVRIAGLCAGGFFPRWFTSQALDVNRERVSYDYVGLNHMNFAFNIRVDGRLLSNEEFNRVADQANWGAVSHELMKTLRLIPSPYLQYYFHRSKKVKEAAGKAYTRGEEVQKLEEEIFAAYADQSQSEKPAALAKRGGGGYSEVALGVMDALYNNVEKRFVVNVPQGGAVPGYAPEAVFEIPCLVSASGIQPLSVPYIPAAVQGIIAAVKNYEQLAVEAALTGNRETALIALMAHPLVGDYDIACPMLEEMLEANRAYLPQFFPDGRYPKSGYFERDPTRD
jgi:6-phospho-beta-glucosidase